VLIIIFTCLKCKKEFTIEERYLLKKVNISCPNCEAEVSPELLTSLKSVFTRIPLVTGTSPTGSPIKDKSEWKIQIDLELK